MIKPKVYLIGAGPSGRDFITVKGLKILQQADVVIYDYLVDKRLLDETKDAELICCDKLGKNRYSDGFIIHQEKINNLIVKKAKEGKKVVRLKNGDPSIFSRCSQELGALVANNIEFELVPGVTAASAAGCLSGIPLTDRKLASSCVFAAGHEDPNKKSSLLDWDALSKAGTIVLYMGVENLDKIVTHLLNNGKNLDTPVAIIQNAGLITQKILVGTLNDIVIKAKNGKIIPPAIVIIGEVVRFEKKFNWFRKNKRILFTGLSGERFFIKGTYFHLPLIKIEPLKDYTKFDGYLKNISEFDWIVFTSRYAVEYFFKRLKFINYDSRVLGGIKIAAIGSSTKNRLLDFGIIADLVAKKESSKGLLEEFSDRGGKKVNIKNKTIFLPRSDISDKGLAYGLRNLGAKVNACIAYRNVMPRDLPDLDTGSFDEIMFTSPSGVRNFLKRYGRPPKKVKIKCIGSVSRAQVKKLRL